MQQRIDLIAITKQRTLATVYFIESTNKTVLIYNGILWTDEAYEDANNCIKMFKELDTEIQYVHLLPVTRQILMFLKTKQYITQILCDFQTGIIIAQYMAKPYLIQKSIIRKNGIVVTPRLIEDILQH